MTSLDSVFFGKQILNNALKYLHPGKGEKSEVTCAISKSKSSNSDESNTNVG
jgi:hypothetical protein